jgi:hypothetical protein
MIYRRKEKEMKNLKGGGGTLGHRKRKTDPAVHVESKCSNSYIINKVYKINIYIKHNVLLTYVGDKNKTFTHEWQTK